MLGDLPTEIISALLAVLVAPVAATFTWRLSKRKQAAETQTSIATGANYAVDAMLKVLEQLRREVAELTNEAEQLRIENHRLHSEVTMLRKMIEDLGGKYEVGL